VWQTCDIAVVTVDFWRVWRNRPTRFGAHLGEAHCRNKRALAGAIFTIANAFPVRSDLHLAMTWAVSDATYRGEYELSRRQALHNFSHVNAAGQCPALQRDGTTVQNSQNAQGSAVPRSIKLQISDAGGSIVLTLAAATCALVWWLFVGECRHYRNLRSADLEAVSTRHMDAHRYTQMGMVHMDADAHRRTPCSRENVALVGAPTAQHSSLATLRRHDPP
jgi:hypothetical protein